MDTTGYRKSDAKITLRFKVGEKDKCAHRKTL